jgi:phosphate starvation-inducible protein PhoH
MVLGRLGKGSTMILTGDAQQIDLRHLNDSAIHEVPKVKESKYVYAITLLDNHRHESLDEILRLLQEYS